MEMKANYDKSHLLARTGDNVTIHIPNMDKTKENLKNVIGVVLQINENRFYKTGIKHGVLQKFYCR